MNTNHWFTSGWGYPVLAHKNTIIKTIGKYEYMSLSFWNQRIPKTLAFGYSNGPTWMMTGGTPWLNRKIWSDLDPVNVSLKHTYCVVITCIAWYRLLKLDDVGSHSIWDETRLEPLIWWFCSYGLIFLANVSTIGCISCVASINQ